MKSLFHWISASLARAVSTGIVLGVREGVTLVTDGEVIDAKFERIEEKPEEVKLPAKKTTRRRAK